MEYNFNEIEKRWQQSWKDSNIYKVSNDSDRPKYYVLDMFPYPSGAGLHVGHPLGYIASDIFSRYKRLQGFNVLHPMGFDSFGLPAEQYALETGQHPAVTTEKNISTFRSQMDKIGFCFDWSRELKTSDPRFYKWTQWIFLQLFNSWYNRKEQKAKPIEELIKIFEASGNGHVPALQTQFSFSAAEWKGYDEKTKQDILMHYRLAYCGIGEVNWCEALGTVLANDEVVNGVSERGGYHVEKKKLRQWYLRITEYADRLLNGLNQVEFSDAMKEMQSNWIGRSNGAEIRFDIAGNGPATDTLTVYTTRPDTIFGVDFMVIAPEHSLTGRIATADQKKQVDEYIGYVKSRSERERIAEKKITGCFTGAYCINPFNGRKIPVWVSEYVLAGYGTGAIMGVPCGDERDHKFAKHFNIPVTNIIGAHYNGEEANPTKDAVLENSDFINGMIMKDAMEVVMTRLEEFGIGSRKVNYKMRDAAFSRQRYWGEPFPVKWKDGIACTLPESELPLELPHVENYKPGPDGEGPLANIPEWVTQTLETNTMPGYAGSSWYFLRYMDPHNDDIFCSRKASDYWNQVDLYIGGTEHAVGHLLYSRMWTKFLYDLDLIGYDEPYRKLLNQGMIQGSSRFVYKVLWTGNSDVDQSLLPSLFISKGLYNKYTDNDQPTLDLIKQTQSELIKRIYQNNQPAPGDIQVIPLHVDVNIVDGNELDMGAFRNWKPEYREAVFICENGLLNHSLSGGKAAGNATTPGGEAIYICGAEVEKMSKSKYNTVNPDILVEKYGADTFRMYEMFLGPVEMSKPWDTKGIEGVHRFLRKLWRLFFDEQKGRIWNEEKANEAELKILHRTLKKISEDTGRFSFNTAVSAFMIAVNELSELKCYKKEILEKLLISLAPYAPHISEELWQQLGNTGSIINAAFPAFDAKYILETTKDYPVSINGKVRTNISLPLDLEYAEVEKIVLANETIQKWVSGKPLKKLIYVKGRMINIVN